jgi:hypothetical protein
MIYRVIGHGRKIGTRISGFFTEDIEAASRKDAEKKILDQYENVSDLNIFLSIPHLT